MSQRADERHSRQSWLTWKTLPAMVFLAGVIALSGCGGGDPEPAGDTEDNSTETTSSTDTAPSAGDTAAGDSSSETPSADDLVRIDQAGRKWIGKDIPYDVFYSDPLAVVANSQEVASTSTPVAGGIDVSQPPAGGAGTDKPADPAPAAGGEVDWKAVIPMPILQEEVSRIRNRFSAKLQTVGSYNSAYLEFPPYAASLGAMAEIAIRHPDDVTWKSNAKFIRDLSAQMVEDNLQRGAKSYKQINEPFLNIVDLLSGNSPPGLPDSAEKVDFYEVADFGYLMRRLESLEKSLRTNAGSADALMSNKDDIIQDATVMAALTKVLTQEGYGYAEDEDFLGLANPMVEASLKMAQSARADDYAGYDAALNTVSQSCTQCHSQYRNN